MFLNSLILDLDCSCYNFKKWYIESLGDARFINIDAASYKIGSLFYI
jgi:hypothetical protein